MIKFYNRFLAIRRVGVPLLAAITGHAVGAGACLAISCDIRPAIAPLAKIGFNFVRIGLHPGLASTHFLSCLVGPHRTAQLLLSGDFVTAEKAVEMGLVLEVSDEFDVRGRRERWKEGEKNHSIK
jgi:enoyl-CoA hydratase/carnithine racemase